LERLIFKTLQESLKLFVLGLWECAHGCDLNSIIIIKGMLLGALSFENHWVGWSTIQKTSMGMCYAIE